MSITIRNSFFCCKSKFYSAIHFIHCVFAFDYVDSFVKRMLNVHAKTQCMYYYCYRFDGSMFAITTKGESSEHVYVSEFLNIVCELDWIESAPYSSAYSVVHYNLPTFCIHEQWLGFC